MGPASKLRKAPDLNAFLDGADRPEEPKAPRPAPEPPKKEPAPPQQRRPSRKPLPWEAERIRDDVIKLYNLRLPEPLMLKLRFIADHSPDSMQSFCLKILRPAIEKRAKELSERVL